MGLFCISHDTFGKGLNPSVLSPALGKIFGQIVFFGIATSCTILLKINLESHLTWGRLFVCLFGLYGISTFVGYLMPNSFLYK